MGGVRWVCVGGGCGGVCVCVCVNVYFLFSFYFCLFFFLLLVGFRRLTAERTCRHASEAYWH